MLRRPPLLHLGLATPQSSPLVLTASRTGCFCLVRRNEDEEDALSILWISAYLGGIVRRMRPRCSEDWWASEREFPFWPSWHGGKRVAGFAIVCNGLPYEWLWVHSGIAESEMSAIDSVWLSVGCSSNCLANFKNCPGFLLESVPTTAIVTIHNALDSWELTK